MRTQRVRTVWGGGGGGGGHETTLTLKWTYTFTKSPLSSGYLLNRLQLRLSSGHLLNYLQPSDSRFTKSSGHYERM